MSDVTGLELRSAVDAEGQLTLSLEEVTHGAPAADEVVVRVEAAPINPSDLGLLLGPADVASLTASGTAERPVLTFQVPRERMGGVRARIGQSLPVGNEGAGTVIAGMSARKSVGHVSGAAAIAALPAWFATWTLASRASCEMRSPRVASRL